MLTAMARELVENKGIGESAAAIWRSVGQLQPATSAAGEGEPALQPVDGIDTQPPEAIPLPNERIPDAALMDNARFSTGSSRKRGATGQLSLF